MLQFEKLLDGSILVYYERFDKSKDVIGTLVIATYGGDWDFRPHRSHIYWKDMVQIAEKLTELNEE